MHSRAQEGVVCLSFEMSYAFLLGQVDYVRTSRLKKASF